MSKLVSLRLDDELAAWAEEYAAARKLSRSTVIEMGLRALRGGAQGGVPDPPAPEPRSRPARPSRPALPPSVAGMVAPASSLLRRGVDDAAAARQAKLNAAKYQPKAKR